jgi:hypothetical protein
MFEFDHDVLSNLAFSLVAKKETEKDIWRLFVQAVCKHPLRVPVHYLQNIKFAKLYITSLYNWNLKVIYLIKVF